MKSAGNDIVALGSIDKQRTKESRFYSKILSAPEQALYQQPEIAVIPFENYVWLLWSVKESVYKYFKRSDPGLQFSPTKIHIQHIELPSVLTTGSGGTEWESADPETDFYWGTVSYGPHTLYFRSKISEVWIATVVDDDKAFEAIYWGVQAIDNPGYKQQSTAARAALLRKLSAFFPGDLRVTKSPVGYPVILNNTEEMPILASLAHDGCFVAYSFLLDAENVCG